MRRLIPITLALILVQCTTSPGANENKSASGKKEVSKAKNGWTYKAVEIDSSGWGYQLFRGSHLEIYQKNVPAISGIHCFETQEKAEIAAQFALDKIEQGFYPPTVKPEELDSIGAIDLDRIIEKNNDQLPTPLNSQAKEAKEKQ